MLKCDKCGSEIPENSKFCPECADPVTEADIVNLKNDIPKVNLVCPFCEKQAHYSSTDDPSRYSCVCSSCQKQFTALLTIVRSKTSRGDKKHSSRDYSVRVKHFDGSEELISFHGSYQDFEMRSKDLVGFISVNSRICVVQNFKINSYQRLYNPNASCYIVSTIYGEASPEVNALRIFRDRTLQSNKILSLVVQAYYSISKVLLFANSFPIVNAIIRIMICPIAFCYTNSLRNRNVKYLPHSRP